MVYVASAPVIKCYDVAFVKFIAPEFAAERDFFVDFGLQIVASHSNETTAYMKGQGAEPVAVVVEKGAKAFGGLGIRAKSVEDLEVLARKTGGEVESMGQGPWPAETKVVRLRGGLDWVTWTLPVLGDELNSARLQTPTGTRLKLSQVASLSVNSLPCLRAKASTKPLVFRTHEKTRSSGSPRTPPTSSDSAT